MSQTDLEWICNHVRETVLLETTLGVLEWDERTGLPPRGGAYRADQTTRLAGMIHRRKIDPELGQRLRTLVESDFANSCDVSQASTLLRLHKDFIRNSRLPVRLVEAITKATAHGQQAWEIARRENRWADFEPHLREIVELRREEAELLRESGQTLYDALLDQYEEGVRCAELNQVFATLRDSLIPLVQELTNSKKRPSGDAWKTPIPVSKQRSVSRWIAEKIGFDFDRGRLDETTHPFCATLGPDDCRILTRYHEAYFPTSFFGTLHEAGHGLYEQGLPRAWFGLPAGSAASLGMHESQSRLWENFVGRSESFWRWCFPELKSALGGLWDHLSLAEVYRDCNLVQPSLIRVEADEVTYNLHILIRFEVEQQLLGGDLAVADAPQAWNERYRNYLGIEPLDERDGILQDVHWSAGLIGYFPTYTLGNLYAAQLMHAAEEALGDAAGQFSSGEFCGLLEWMREKVHQHGRCFSAVELIERATGSPLDASALVRYLRNKLEPIYN